MVIDYNIALENFMGLYTKLLKVYPRLDIKFKFNLGGPSFLIEKQEGISHDIHILLEINGDFISQIGNFYGSWPLCDQEDAYIFFENSIFSFIDGKARVVEYFEGGKYCGSDFQLLKTNDWITIKSHILFWPGFLFWKKKTTKLLKVD